MALVLVDNGVETVDVVCNICDQVVVSGVEASYFAENPNASERWLHQLAVEHESHDCLPEVVEANTFQIICPDCGEVLAEYDSAYAEQWPNSLDRWEGQLLEQHAPFCEANLESFTKIPGGEITFPDGNKKSYSFTPWSCSYGIFFQLTWGKGGTKSSRPAEIYRQWKAVVPQLKEAILKAEEESGEECVSIATAECASAMAYEIKMKTGVVVNMSKIKALWEGKLKKLLEWERQNKLLPEEEVKEIVEEA